jgi:protein-S-isoprenylcysteine O-methyltransferase Ste14
MLDSEQRATRVETPAVRAHPPTIFLAALAVASLLGVVLPFGPGIAQGASDAFWVGFAFFLIGLAVSLWAVRAILAAGSHVPTWQPTLALATGGPYRLSRNPIYIGMLVLFFGVALMLTNPWMLLVMPAMIWVLQDAVIAPEERFLERRFGAAYTDYARRVPRWM